MSRMEDGLLSLKWNNHKSTFFHILSSLRKKETYTDATLACEGKFFPVHKLVMSTCSDYFSEIFERTNCKSPVVILKDIRYHDLESLLDYMYLGEVDVKQSELASLIKAAECLRIKGLAVPDEDPSLSHKKSSSSFESRASPSSKRSRTESSGAASDSQHYVPHSNKVRRSVSPTRSHSSSACGINTPVPSQSVNSDPLSQVPGAGLSMPPPSFSETKHLPGGSTTSDHQTSSTSSSTSSAHDGSNLVPVEMIKVEVDDDGNSSGGGGSNGSQLRRHHQDGGLPPPDQGGGRNERSCEDGGGEGSESEKSSLTNSYGAGYSSHPGEIEKEEHDQIDTFNGSDQMAGPSGVQGGSQMLNWGEEEGNFPHNLFGGEDSSHQQVTLTQDSSGARKGSKRRKGDGSFDRQTSTKTNTIFFSETGTKIYCVSSDDSETSDFEGFEVENYNVSELKKKAIDRTYDMIIRAQNSSMPAASSPLPPSQPSDLQFSPVQPSTSSPLGRISPLSLEFQEYTPFEVFAQEYEEELAGIVPFEVSFREQTTEYVPPGRKGKISCLNCHERFGSKKKLQEHQDDHNACVRCCPACPYRGREILKHLLFHTETNSKGQKYCILCKKGPILTMNHHYDHLNLVHSYNGS